MLQTKQKQQQHLYQQMQQFPHVPILSRVPSTHSPMAPLLALPNQPPRLHVDHRMHPGARMTHRPMVGRPPISVVRPGSASTQSLLGPKPMMQQPVVMHQMPGISGGSGKRLPPPFLPTGVRQSLLGPAPVGTSLRNAHMGFVPGHQLNLYCPPYKNKKGVVLTTQRIREHGQKPAGKSNGQMTKSKADIITSQKEKKMEMSIKDGQGSSNEQTEPLAKKQKNQRADEDSESGDAECRTAGTDSSVLPEQDEEEIHSAEAEEDLEQGRTAEVQGVGTSLKVTIQRSSDSRAFSTGLEESPAAAGQSTDKEKSESAGELCCKICNVTCPDQQDFQTHMISLDHQMRMMEIQHLSNTCLATLLPQIQQTLQGTLRDKKQGPRWCAFCQCHFSGDLIEHRRTKKHKMAKVSSRPFCTVCERHFRTPRKFVEHMKSPEHKQRVEELREEGGPEVMEELITVDAVGCFEGEDDYEEEGNEDEEDTVTEQLVLSEEINDCNDYDPDTQYGTSFVVPVAGFLCKLCHKFYHFESKAREAHCKSLMHYQNLQKYKAMLNLPQEDEEILASSLGENPENSRDCAVEMDDKYEEVEKSKSQSDTT